MKKVIGFILGGISYLLFAIPAFAATNVPIAPPKGAIDVGEVKIEKIPQFILNLLFLVGVIVAVAFLIYGGIRWIISGGDKTAVESARNHIVAAIVGLVIVAGAFFIVQVVFSLLGVSNPLSETFTLPTLKNP